MWGESGAEPPSSEVAGTQHHSRSAEGAIKHRNHYRKIIALIVDREKDTVSRRHLTIYSLSIDRANLVRTEVIRMDQEMDCNRVAPVLLVGVAGVLHAGSVVRQFPLVYKAA